MNIKSIIFLIIIFLSGYFINGFAEDTISFTYGRVYFEYPKRWISLDHQSFKTMEAAAKQQGIDLLLIITPNNEMVSLSVVRTPFQKSFETLFSEKKNIADQVNSQGIDLLGQRYIRYQIHSIPQANFGRILLIDAERSDHQIGASYQFLDNGYEYDINFVYKDSTQMANHEKVRNSLIESLRFAH